MNIGEYNITTERSENPLYRWVEAVNSQKEKTVIIQILQPGISPEITANLISYFDTLQAIRRKNLWLPEQVFSNADYPLVLVYPYLSTTPLGEIFQASTEEEAIEWWHQASETLHTLHNKNIVHGRIALDSFVVVERSVCLTGFGYAPLLQMGEPKAILECEEVVAPEVLADQVQLLLKKGGLSLEGLSETERRKSHLKLLEAAIEAKITLSATKETDVCVWDVIPGKYIETKVTRPEFENLIQVYLTSAADIYGFAKTVAHWQKRLVMTSWYSKAANLNPESRYPRIRDCFQALQETLLRSVSEKHNPAQRTKKSKDDRETESKHQHQDIIPKYILEVKVEPSEAGEVFGGGSYSSYPEPKSVLVKAQPLAGWHFDHWSGDIEGKESPVTLTMDHDKLIVAYFVPSISPTELDNSTPNTEGQREILVPNSLPETLFDDSSTKKRLEQEKLESEKKARLEAERKLKVKEEQERQRVERERIEKEKLEAKTRRKNGIMGLLVGLCLAGGTVIFSLVQQQQQQQNVGIEPTIIDRSSPIETQNNELETDNSLTLKPQKSVENINVGDAISIIENLYYTLSAKKYNEAEQLYSPQLASAFNPSFFDQFERVTVEDLQVTSQTESSINFVGQNTYVYPDGSTQREERSYTVRNVNGELKITSSEFIKVTKFK